MENQNGEGNSADRRGDYRRDGTQQCVNYLGKPKVTYTSALEAQPHVDRLQRMQNASTRRPYVAYHCAEHGGWHVGRSEARTAGPSRLLPRSRVSRPPATDGVLAPHSSGFDTKATTPDSPPLPSETQT